MLWGSGLLWDLSCLETVLQDSLHIVSSNVEVKHYVCTLGKTTP